MNVLGITLGHDTSFACVADGEVVGIMEAERYFRQKHYKLHCLSLTPGKQISGYQYVDVTDLELFLSFVAKEWGTTFDSVAVQNQARTDEYKNLLLLLAQTGFKFDAAYLVNHHLCHAAVAFYTSPFEEALILSYDGFGNDGQTIIFKADAETGIEYAERIGISFGRSYNNLGYIVGIKPDVSGTSSGKTMGLVAYGALRDDWLPYARKYVREYRKLPARPVDGLNNYGKGHRVNSIGLDEIPDLQRFVSKGERMQSPGLWSIARRLGGRDSLPELRLPGPEDKLAQDLVRTVQAAWTEEVLELLRPYRHVSRNLCVSGGCALSGITNFAIQQSGMFQETYFIPNPSDCGLSAGAALYVSHKLGGVPFKGSGTYFSPYLGVEPFDRNELPVLKQSYPHRELRPEETLSVLARLIYADRIVGVIRDRYEVGPRALGNRSILCNPLNRDMREILNRKVKYREWFRPFAPVAPADDAHEYFTNGVEIPYMSVICYTRPEYAERLPSVTHADGSARLQTVRREHHPFIFDTLKEFEKLSGIPVLLNTSFNPKGEPILNFCAVALEMLKTTELDLVLIDNTLFCRPGREHLLDVPSQSGKRA